MATILLIDDDDAFSEGLAETLTDLGHDVERAASGESGLARLTAGLTPACVFLDFRLPGIDGLAVLEKLRDMDRVAQIPVVMLTAHANSDNTIGAMRLGAFEHLTKPVGREDIARLLKRVFVASPISGAAAGGTSVPPTFDEPDDAMPRLLGISESMREVQKRIGRAAASDATVLLTGETGTGKEVAARVLHQSSRRATGPFIAVNCAAIPHELLESELFGHGKGAFTGASAARTGRIVDANRGTLFLDEIGDMPAAMQAKLLRVLQERLVTPLGSNESVAVDVRVIAATHRALDAMVATGEFRQDLLYRLNVIPIHLPPLRERLADILPLAEYFLKATALDQPKRRFSVEAQRRLLTHSWPGNVRELRNAVERVNALSPGPVVTETDLTLLTGGTASGSPLPACLYDVPLAEALQLVEREAIRRALDVAGGNRAEAARRLGISRQSLYTRMAALGID
ncbi:sigma-54 dependent transcriptional regulator [Paraburkholderia caribensis]|jgi:DNA-binding NtrC family response regulator|uniref:sigma-54-dependent transcriptional regulator n=1 Tax=Paraburkholderia TaxID=1822464 RepID=UPI001CAC3221|nr:sigma-54 dependent transcriptional regulator [Paraburkholderia caribensis]BEU28185.1 sigma-54 dependent transcriptional regulator [Paraburkholderia sp. 22B1P]CAG9253680.1 Transcriptional regulatory protein ZraR [Paraburkholderia caribensis]